MHTHANARLTQRGRLRLVSQHLHENRALPELAAEAGISLRCAYKWLARYRSGGAAALADRRSVRRTQRWTLDPQHLQRAVELRHQRLHLRHIARLLAAPFSTVARALNRLGLRWVLFIGQFWPLTSLTPGGRNRVLPQCRPDGEFCLPRSCEALHGSTSTGIGPG
jgi:transposase